MSSNTNNLLALCCFASVASGIAIYVLYASKQEKVAFLPTASTTKESSTEKGLKIAAPSKSKPTPKQVSSLTSSTATTPSKSRSTSKATTSKSDSTPVRKVSSSKLRASSNSTSKTSTKKESSKSSSPIETKNTTVSKTNNTEIPTTTKPKENGKPAVSKKLTPNGTPKENGEATTAKTATVVETPFSKSKSGTKTKQDKTAAASTKPVQRKPSSSTNGNLPAKNLVDCRFYTTSGFCKYGDECDYNHPEIDEATLAKLRESAPRKKRSRNRNRRKKPANT